MLPNNVRQSTTESASPNEVATAEGFDGTVTVHLRSTVPDVARERQRVTLDELEALAASGTIDELEINRWPNKVPVPTDGPPPEVVDTYEAFVDRVGEHALEPFFERRPGVGHLESVLVLPVLCLAARRDGDLVGLYPRWNDGTHDSIEDGLDALLDGTVENV